MLAQILIKAGLENVLWMLNRLSNAYLSSRHTPLIQAELSIWGCRAGPRNRERVHPRRAGSSKGEAHEGLSQAPCIPSRKPSNERRRRPRHPRLMYRLEKDEGGQMVGTLVVFSWKHDTEDGDAHPTLSSFVLSPLTALLEGLDEQVSGPYYCTFVRLPLPIPTTVSFGCSPWDHCCQFWNPLMTKMD